MTTRVLIADDHDLVRHGFRMILDAQPDMRVVGEAADGEAALAAARRLRPDVVLADIRMPRLDGIEVLKRLNDTEDSNPPRVIVVTTFDDDDYVRAALTAGASGFVLKRSGPTLLVEAVRAAVAGDTLVSPSLTVRLLRGLAAPEPTTGPELSERERQVVKLVAEGKSNAEVAAELYISTGTVKTHLANAQRKTGSRNRVGMAAWAWRTGLAAP
ncbi:response regulator transcription factor [Glycomyces sp. NRRL B-16210]|uniref:response regulator n=1 Tax=Glycomyces sp. NRRL B-16210 TaxID=1463821 RepID=UPI0004BFD3EF|nr:response regulator transcription factor [Glycomyces sp. NRRL B-16210]